MHSKITIEKTFHNYYKAHINVIENSIIHTRTGDKLGHRIILEEPFPLKFSELSTISSIIGTEHINFKYEYYSRLGHHRVVIEAWD